MKKTVLIIATMIVIILGMFVFANSRVYAAESVIDNNTQSKLIEIKESQTKTLEDYKVKYGSDTYGIVAYILNIVRIYSIPFCFLGIAIGAIHKYIIPEPLLLLVI